MYNYISDDNLGDVWFKSINLLIENGEPIDNEILELRNLLINFYNASKNEKYFSFPNFQENINEMENVFFSKEGKNKFHHSYSDKIRNPLGGNDLDTIISMLKRKPSTKQAILYIIGEGDGKVPCITSIQFLIRNCKIELFYTSRGQDMFNKFYADALCIYEIGNIISNGLKLPLSNVSGAISSAHIYISDIPSIKEYRIAIQKNNFEINS